MDIYIGPAGWAYEDWEGAVYPARGSAGFDRLGYLSNWFDCIEINSTFYRMPSARVCAGWAERTRGRPRFLFTVKLHRGFTHETGGPPAGAAAAFLGGIAPLSESGRLGSLLAQFPWSFRNSAAGLSRIERLVEEFAGFPIAVEVRHASWNTAAFYDFLERRGAGVCNIDQPLRRSSMPPSARSTAPTGYFRLHGLNYAAWFREGADRDERYDYLYEWRELEAWASRVSAAAARTARVFVILNNHYRGKAVCNALELKALLSGAPVDIPPPLLDAFPRLAHIARSPGAGAGMLPGF
jgi:uncharacterized protein YecE (DUF72 family)